MGIFAIGIEHPLDMTVQRLHDPDPRHHRRASARKHQRLDRGLPLGQIGVCSNARPLKPSVPTGA